MHAILILIAAFGITAVASAGNVKVGEGSKDVGVLEGGSRLIVTLARRENFNAHGFEVVIFSAKVPSEDGELIAHVPFFDGDKETPTIQTRDGADCVVKDFRLVSETRKYKLIVGEREFGSSFADSESVTYTIYELKRNAEELIGHPHYYFERVGTKVSDKKHCDVGEAFKDDWNLGENRESLRANS